MSQAALGAFLGHTGIAAQNLWLRAGYFYISMSCMNNLNI
jgi:hypothetical protein